MSPGTLRLLEVSQDLLSLGASRLDVADHVEGTLRQVVALSVDDALERTDGVLEIDKLALDTGENLGNSERLAQETLELAGTLDGKLVCLGKFVHTENGNC